MSKRGAVKEYAVRAGRFVNRVRDPSGTLGFEAYQLHVYGFVARDIAEMQGRSVYRVEESIRKFKNRLCYLRNRRRHNRSIFGYAAREPR